MTVEYLGIKDSFEKLKIIDELKMSSYDAAVDYEVLDYLSSDDDYEVRAKVAEVLVFSNNSIAEKILIRLLKDKDELVRVNACDSLCLSESFEVIGHLRNRILKDKSSLVRGYAVSSLADIVVRLNFDLDESKEFFEIAFKKERVNWVKINIYKALYMLGDKFYLNTLIKELNNRYYRNRCNVVNILDELVSNENIIIIKSALIERLKIESTIAVKSSIEDVLKNIDT